MPTVVGTCGRVGCSHTGLLPPPPLPLLLPPRADGRSRERFREQVARLVGRGDSQGREIQGKAGVRGCHIQDENRMGHCWGWGGLGRVAGGVAAASETQRGLMGPGI